jgi:cytochrome P450
MRRATASAERSNEGETMEDNSGESEMDGAAARFEPSALTDFANPQPRYREMVKEELVCPVEGVAMAASRAAVDAVLRNHEVFTSEFGLDLGNTRPLIPLSVDPPRHGKYRKILDPLFAPKQMDHAEADITVRANHFIDTFVDKGECNFTEEYAELFPSAIFLGLMGLPWDELDTFLRLRDGILRPDRIDPEAAFLPEVRLKVARATGVEIYEYFGEIVDRRKAEPQDDILTHFVTAEVDGAKLSRDEILDICFLFLIAGLDTVSDSLTCFYAFLARSPEHRRQIAENPDVIPAAVEELLRWESPVPMVPRSANADTEICGHAVAAGTMVMPALGAANVDPAEFEDPFVVRFDREVNRHIAFGGGVHRCLGSHLARRELRVTLRGWHRRIPEYSIKSGHEELVYGEGLRSVRNLVLTWPQTGRG